jgi:hypothetical protein
VLDSGQATGAATIDFRDDVIADLGQSNPPVLDRKDLYQRSSGRTGHRRSDIYIPDARENAALIAVKTPRNRDSELLQKDDADET